VADYKILVVDDEPEILNAVGAILESVGYEVETARNGQEALDRLDGMRPDLVILDMWMPVLDGFSFVRRARADGFDLKILVMTAGDSVHAWAERVHAQGYLPKPFDLDQLLQTVDRLCAAA
jgi:CheY-like chemotaxis protein